MGHPTFMKRYRTYSQYLKEQFGVKVQKVMIDAGFTCPNRDGTKAVGGCTFCDDDGSGSPLIRHSLPVREQVRLGIEHARKSGAAKFIAYFQSFSNTYAPVETLSRLYREALDHPDVVGLAIGTRPDCVSEAVLDLLAELSRQTRVWVEYGLQSAHNQTLELLNRAHTAEEFVDAVERTQRRGIPVCAHLILGLPHETPEMMIASARLIAALQTHAIKIHFLYLEEGMALAAQYRKGTFRLIEKETYLKVVCDILEMLPPQMVVERLTGDPNPKKLVAPAWALEKSQLLNAIDKELERRDSFQGKLYQPLPVEI